MKVTKLRCPQLLIIRLQEYLKPFGIALYEIDYPTRSSVKFRAKRKFNKPYYAGGTKYGNPCQYNMYFEQKARNTAHLHWEEWAVINDAINKICDDFYLCGSFKSYFDGELQWVRNSGDQVWFSGFGERHVQELKDEARTNNPLWSNINIMS